MNRQASTVMALLLGIIADWLERHGPSDQPDHEPVGHLTPHGGWTTKLRQDIDD